jgi:hypothetical protein
VAKKRVPRTKSGPKPESAPAVVPRGYEELLGQLKERIRSAQLRAALAVNRELIGLYWQLGQSIVERQRAEGWGKSVVERLARDLQAEFPGIGGFSPRNVWRMRAFYLAYTEEVRKLPRAVAEMDGENLPRPVAEIPWGHNADLLDKVNGESERMLGAQAIGRRYAESPIMQTSHETSPFPPGWGCDTAPHNSARLSGPRSMPRHMADLIVDRDQASTGGFSLSHSRVGPHDLLPYEGPTWRRTRRDQPGLWRPIGVRSPSDPLAEEQITSLDQTNSA